MRTVFFNGNPLLRFDGYFVLADLIEVPNLNERSGRLIRDWFLTGGLGVRESDEQHTSRHTKTLLATYNILSYVYKVFVVYMVAFVIVEIFRPVGLEQISIMFSIGVMIALTLLPLFALGKYFWIPGRRERIKRFRLIGTMAAFLLLAGFICFVPLPDHVKCQFDIQPTSAATLYANQHATLEKLLVRPGDRVSKGQMIGQLRNLELDLERSKVEGKVLAVSVTLDRIFTHSQSFCPVHAEPVAPRK